MRGWIKLAVMVAIFVGLVFATGGFVSYRILLAQQERMLAGDKEAIAKWEEQRNSSVLARILFHDPGPASMAGHYENFVRPGHSEALPLPATQPSK